MHVDESSLFSVFPEWLLTAFNFPPFKKVFIVYVKDVVPGINPKTNKEEKGYVIFDESHDALSRDAIDWAWETYRRKNIIRQNIVSTSNSLLEILSKIDPEFDAPFWDFGDEYVARCKQLWRSI